MEPTQVNQYDDENNWGIIRFVYQNAKSKKHYTGWETKYVPFISRPCKEGDVFTIEEGKSKTKKEIKIIGRYESEAECEEDGERLEKDKEKDKENINKQKKRDDKKIMKDSRSTKSEQKNQKSEKKKSNAQEKKRKSKADSMEEEIMKRKKTTESSTVGTYSSTKASILKDANVETVRAAYDGYIKDSRSFYEKISKRNTDRLASTDFKATMKSLPANSMLNQDSKNKITKQTDYDQATQKQPNNGLMEKRPQSKSPDCRTLNDEAIIILHNEETETDEENCSSKNSTKEQQDKSLITTHMQNENFTNETSQAVTPDNHPNTACEQIDDSKQKSSKHQYSTTANEQIENSKQKAAQEDTPGDHLITSCEHDSSSAENVIDIATSEQQSNYIVGQKGNISEPAQEEIQEGQSNVVCEQNGNRINEDCSTNNALWANLFNIVMMIDSKIDLMGNVLMEQTQKIDKLQSDFNSMKSITESTAQPSSFTDMLSPDFEVAFDFGNDGIMNYPSQSLMATPFSSKNNSTNQPKTTLYSTPRQANILQSTSNSKASEFQSNTNDRPLPSFSTAFKQPRKTSNAPKVIPKEKAKSSQIEIKEQPGDNILRFYLNGVVSGNVELVLEAIKTKAAKQKERHLCALKVLGILFSNKEFVECNYDPKKPLRPLSHKKVNAVRKITFAYWPSNEEEAEWKEIHKLIVRRCRFQKSSEKKAKEAKEGVI